ncbi:LexA regulated protein [Oceanobacter mangrovi]|uniref:LexA regulated protein n=1 Tax=Oceanobacter mangrovi TaxID=2862510 RepID=UPI001C8D2CD3|nr:LexA regulated protein [Oceanobacter mangrovi]
MSVQPEDRTTIDMFSSPRRGRPKSSPYDRRSQSRFNKRFQRERDKQRGLQRLEVKIDGDIIDRLDEVAGELNLTRADVISLALKQWLHL